MKDLLPGVVQIETCDPRLAEARYCSILDSITEDRQIAIVIEATSACNLNCSFCGMHSKELSRLPQNGALSPKKITSIDVDLFQSIISKCAMSRKLKILYLHGHGEPLLHAEIARLVSIAKHADVAEQIAIVTNGTVLTPSLLRRLVESGLDQIRVSLDLFSPEAYAIIKGKNLALVVRRNLEDCLREIRSKKLPIRLSIECMNWKGGDSELTKETEKIVSHFAPIISETPDACIRIRDEFGWLDQLGAKGVPESRTVPCEQAFYIMLVHADGDISACCADSTKSLLIGNIREFASLVDIINSDRLFRIRESLLKQDYQEIEICRKCDVLNSIDFMLYDRRSELIDLIRSRRMKLMRTDLSG